MRIGYIRVSTAEQNTIRQEVLMRELEVDELFIDRASGKNLDRTELKRMLDYVRKGDTVIVESISRFARNTRDLLELVERLTAKEVEFVSSFPEIVNFLSFFLRSGSLQYIRFDSSASFSFVTSVVDAKLSRKFLYIGTTRAMWRSK